jgi:glutamyl-tRNA synthetase
MATGPRFRFAPSPTGSFHVGGARTALHNWALARRLGGTFVLRIEDTDEARNRPEWTQGIIDALAWIGISADDPHFEGPHFQSEYAPRTSTPRSGCTSKGHAYYCDLTGEQIQERAKELGVSGYDGYSRDRGLGAGAGAGAAVPGARRVTVVHDLVRGEVSFDNSTIEDFVLLRGNGTPVFLLANVVDDIEMGITHVVRAEEHLPNTPKQQMLWEALGHEPPQWAHVPVLVNEQRKKLSKRRDKVALEQYRDEGYLADAMVNYLMTLGWTPPGAEESGSEIASWADMEAAFRLEDVTHSPAFFDVKKLAAFNGEYIRRMPLDEFIERAAPTAGRLGSRAVRSDRPAHPGAPDHAREVPDKVDFLFWPDGEPVEYDERRGTRRSAEWAVPLLDDVISAYAALADWTADALKVSLEDGDERYELKLGKAQAPVRVAVTGRSVGPPLFESLEVLGRDETLRRLTAAIERAPDGERRGRPRVRAPVRGGTRPRPRDSRGARRASVRRRAVCPSGRGPSLDGARADDAPDPHAGVVRDPTPVRPLAQPPRSVARRVLQVVVLCVLALLATTGCSPTGRCGRPAGPTRRNRSMRSWCWEQRSTTGGRRRSWRPLKVAARVRIPYGLPRKYQVRATLRSGSPGFLDSLPL